ncbi:hypothetical protein [Bacillus toyonensis]|uniref:hypothetical protein n=1 Tax=Bacillus toyonensis TaxID=155322 RepID=UPI0020D273CE|nr:hypothetical protein [Bacillus toyonensis]
MTKVAVTVIEKTDISRKQNIVVHGSNGTDLYYFNSKEQLDRFCELTGVKLTQVMDIDSPNYGHCIRYETEQLLENKVFYSNEELPTGVTKCKGLVGQYVVDCYVLVEGNKTTIYTPHQEVPNIFNAYDITEQLNSFMRTEV